MTDSHSKAFIRRVLSPIIAVASSPDLDELCQLNNISTFTELIRPFGIDIEGKVTLRDTKGLVKSLSHSSVRFVELNKLDPATLNTDDALLSRNLSDSIKNQARSSEVLRSDPLLSSPSIHKKSIYDPDEIVIEESHNTHLIQALLQKNLEELTPWFTLYRNSFFQHLRLTEHETFDHPVSCLIATSTSNSQPLDTLTKLYEQTTRLSQWAYFNPDVFQCYLLVHDMRKGNLEKAQSLFDKMKKTLGPHCQLLLINSRPNDRDDQNLDPIVPDVWNRDVWFFDFPGSSSQPQSPKNMEKISKSPLSPGECGHLLSFEDLEAIKTFVKKLFGESVLPHMERSMHLWNEQVASSRRGFTGRLFSASRRYFGSARAPPSSNSSISGGTASPTNSTSYQYNTPEAQLRKLADYAFMLRDYDFARSTYETVKKDFQADSSWKYYAGAQEMTGLCLLFTENSGTKIDIERYYDKAIRYYQSSKMVGWAARCVLLFHSMLKYHRRYDDIPLLMARLTGEESDLRSALFLEQAAHSYLKSTSPRIRKFAFHLILAGHRYNKCNQREHAYHCYQLAAKVFGINEKEANDIRSQEDVCLQEKPQKKWDLIEDHISFSLGRQSYHLGELQNAIQHFSWLLYESNQSQAVQAGYLKEFMYIYKNYIASTGHEILLEPDNILPIPVVDPKTVFLLIPSASTSSDSTVINFEDNNPVWSQLASDLISPEPLYMFHNGLISSSSLQEPELKMCPLKEFFTVSVEIKNPLHISIFLSHLTINCQYEGKSSLGGVNVSSVENITLEGQQSITVTFNITPLEEGILSILGLSLMVNEHARTFKTFYQRGPRLNKTNKQRQGFYYGPNRELTVRIVPPLPKLSLELDGFPETIMSGEIIKGRLRLQNIGHANLSRLGVRLTHPTYFSFGPSEENSKDLLQGQVFVVNHIQDTCSRSLEFFSSPNLGQPSSLTSPLQSLSPGQSAEITIHLRGDRVGSHKFFFLFHYCSEDSQSKIVQYRVAKLVFNCTILPSLKINAFTRPSTQVLGRYILGLEIENVHPENSFRISQVSSISHKWKIASINNSFVTLERESILLAPKQTASLYYSIIQLSDPSKGNSDVSTKSINYESPEALLAASLQNLTLGRRELISFPTFDLTYSNLRMAQESQNFWSHPTKNFYLASRTQNRNHWLSREMAVIEKKLARASFPLFFSNDIDVSLYWETLGDFNDVVTSPRKGHHYIIGIHLGAQQNLLYDDVTLSNTIEDKESKSDSNKKELSKDNAKLNRSLFEGTTAERLKLIRHISSHPRFVNDNPVRITLCSDTEFYGDFTDNMLVQFPISFLVQNWSWNRNVDVSIRLLSTTELKNSSSDDSDNTTSKLNIPLGSDLSSSGFWWRGPQKLSLQLLPGQSSNVSSFITVTKPGVYDLNRWHLDATVHISSSKPNNYRDFLASALDDPGAANSTIQHKFSPSLPHLVHIYRT